MMHLRTLWVLSLAAALGGPSLGWAQGAAPTAAAGTAPASAAPAKAPDALSVLFDPGSAAIRPADEAVLDQASRLYRDGKPIVMVVTGATDTVGSADANLRLSQSRANAVLRGLVGRGIPVDRFQVVGKGATDPAVATDKGVAEPRNRRAEITWR